MQIKRGFVLRLLEERIEKDAVVLGFDVLKVDSFLNHQLDVLFMDKLAAEFAEAFSEICATKILTVEASGIALACAVARLLKLPVVFAKKGTRSNIGNDVYTASCHSFTHNTDYNMEISKKYLSANDRVLIIDDFLATGNAIRALISIIETAKACTAGIGIAIEKGFQGGGRALRDEGYNLRSLAVIESMGNDGIIFGHADR